MSDIRYSGFDCQFEGPLDTRLCVENVSRLLTIENAYRGILVMVHSDSNPDNNTIWTLAGEFYNVLSHWEKVTTNSSGGTGGDGGGGNTPISSNIQAELDSLTTSNTNIQTQINVIQTDITGIQSQISSNQSQISSNQSQINAKHPLINSSARLDAALIHNGAVSNTEFGYLDGVTSAIQTQINAKLPLISSSARLDAALIHHGAVSNTEFGYLGGVTSAIQTQINSKQEELTNTSNIDVNDILCNTITSGDVAKLGAVGSVAQFAHSDFFGTNKYALQQSTNSATFINGSYISFRSDNVETMGITNTGDIGIGKNPSAKLDVDGQIKSTGIDCSGNASFSGRIVCDEIIPSRLELKNNSDTIFKIVSGISDDISDIPHNINFFPDNYVTELNAKEGGIKIKGNTRLIDDVYIGSPQRITSWYTTFDASLNRPDIYNEIVYPFTTTTIEGNLNIKGPVSFAGEIDFNSMITSGNMYSIAEAVANLSSGTSAARAEKAIFSNGLQREYMFDISLSDLVTMQMFRWLMALQLHVFTLFHMNTYILVFTLMVLTIM